MEYNSITFRSNINMEVIICDKFITETRNLKNKKLLETFYNGRNDKYAKEKIKLLRENVTQYWCCMSTLNKEKLLNLMNIDINEINKIENFIKYGWNEPVESFVKNFYNNNFDYDDEENVLKLKNLRENLGDFWNDLSDIEKEKYIKLVNEKYN